MADTYAPSAYSHTVVDAAELVLMTAEEVFMVIVFDDTSAQLLIMAPPQMRRATAMAEPSLDGYESRGRYLAKSRDRHT